MIRLALFVALTLGTSGCAALSLFSTTHEHHYENNPDVNTRISVLEAKVDSLEKAQYPVHSEGAPVLAPPR